MCAHAKCERTLNWHTPHEHTHTTLSSNSMRSRNREAKEKKRVKDSCERILRICGISKNTSDGLGLKRNAQVWINQKMHYAPWLHHRQHVSSTEETIKCRTENILSVPSATAFRWNVRFTITMRHCRVVWYGLFFIIIVSGFCSVGHGRDLAEVFNAVIFSSE